MLIFIDAGHGGSDTGTITPNGTKEKDVTLDIAKRVDKRLGDYGIDTYLLRDSDSFINQKARADLANSQGADYYIMIHTATSSNPSTRGNSGYVYMMGTEAESMARSISHQMRKSGIRDRGTGYSGDEMFGFLDMPAILLEVAYLTSPEDEALVNDEVFAERLAGAISDGIVRYLGVPETEEDVLETESVDDEDNISTESVAEDASNEYVTVEYLQRAVLQIKEYIDQKLQ